MHSLSTTSSCGFERGCNVDFAQLSVISQKTAEWRFPTSGGVVCDPNIDKVSAPQQDRLNQNMHISVSQPYFFRCDLDVQASWAI
jgi:hypothetical protein